MCAQEATEPRSLTSRIQGPLTWLGGGHRREPGERQERATQADEALAGAVVLLVAALAWLVAGLALSQSTRWPTPAVVALTLVFGLLVGAVTRGTAAGPGRRWPGVAARAAVAIAVGVVVGELASLAIFASSIDHRLDERALRNADSAPAVAQASASLQQTKDARGGLDRAVAQARERQDQALVVARCEYNPTPPCPQTRITGVPGAGPETRTANELLADAQRELDTALAARDRQAPELDARISREEQALARAREDVAADAGRGLGARWVAMNDVTLAGAGALALRLAAIAFFALLCLLPLILRLWRGETTHDRHTTARAERERAELEAETAIAIKRAQVRREAEIMWAEHQLTQARLAIEAQTEIDRERQRRRVMDALDAPVRASSRRTFEPPADDMYLPIAAEAEAASRAIAPLPAGTQEPEVQVAPATPANLPAPVEPGGEVEPHDERATPLIPSLPDATRAAARWIRPLVPPFVARVIDNTTQPLRTARHVFEEVEEITFALRRTRKVTLDSESSEPGGQAPQSDEAPPTAGRVRVGGHERRSVRGIAANDVEALTLASRERDAALTRRDGPGELRAPEGPRQLPPGN
ncbi:DUF4407 domain-containing protein [Mycobacterium sp. 1081908.1]|uniref:DUF4407 domain-containing protein n=1 Tax=Mycobacterium sp. 1081908.1 TaxID=1834066 RepID=UPI0008023608|nr:DUF4407 domain-containing protein [Mycobacterium sp. 1081908.1]OBK48855.1 hypothetical protein A5655_03620 [Mycobacterium sp. 1081908.1]